MEHAHTVDASLVAEALGGDRDAFGALVVRYFNPAYAVALAHLGHHESAQDAVQEAFLNAYRRLNTLRDPERFREWLITIVRNACYSLRRKERPMVPLDAVAEPAEALDLERRELHALIRSKIAELDESPREALLLYYFSGQSQAEIADLLGISHDAAQKRVSRAREVLGQRLVDEVEGALGLNAEEHTKREKQALAAVMAAPIPWDITKASAAGGAASASYTAYILVAFAVLLLVAAGLVVRQAFNAAPAPPEAAPAVAAPSEPAESADEISPAPPSAPPIIAATPRPTSRWAEGVAETAGDLSITCQVVDERDRPAADVAVRLTVFGYAGEDPVGRVLMRKVARTDDEGWFEIAGLPYHIEQDLASDYVVDAVAVNGFASLRLYYDNVFESRRLRLAPAGPIAGTVVDEAGVPIEGATVYPVKSSAIERIGTEEMAAWAVVSGPSGRFAFSALPDGVWTVAVVHDGHAMVVADGVPTNTDDCRFVMKGPDTSGSIQGQVREMETGSPLPGVWVVLDQAPVRWLHRKWTQTDDQGQFKFDTLGIGKHVVDVEDPNWAMQAEGPLIELAEGQHAETTLEVGAGATVSGRVFRDDTGEGVEGVTVFVSPRSSNIYRWYASNQVVRRAVTNRNGDYVVDGLRPVEFNVQCGSLPGTLATVGEWYRKIKVQTAGNVTVDIPVREGIAVLGHVFNQEGHAIGMAHIQFQSSVISGIRQVVTNGAGEFAIPGILTATDDLGLYARRAGWAMTPIEPFAIAGTGRDDIVLTMIRDRCVSGTVTSRAGKPVKGAGIMAIGPHQYAAVGNLTNSDAQGRFFIAGLYPGEYHFAVTPPDSMRYGGTDRQGPFTIDRETITNDVALVFDTESNLTIEGTVRDTNGTLVIADITAVGPVTVHGMSDSYIGHFTLDGLAPGEYVVSAWRQGRTTSISGVAAGSKDVELLVDASVSLSGSVVDKNSGERIVNYKIGYVVIEPDTGATVWKIDPGEHSTTDGTFEYLDSFRTLPAGDITLSVVADGFAALGYPLGVLAPGETRAGIVIPLVPARIVNGTVVDAKGAAVAGARVTVKSQSGRVPELSVETRADGVITLTSVAPEHDLVVATHPEYAPGVVGLPKAGDVHVVLENGVPLSGRVTMEGYAAEKTHVRAQHVKSGLGGDAPCGADGVFRIEHLASGTHEVRVWLTPVDEESRSGIELSRMVDVGGPESVVELSGEGGNAAVDALVEEDVGENLHVRVVQVNALGVTQTTRIYSRDGTFVANGLLEGPAVVSLWIGDADDPYVEREIELKAGERTAVTLP